MVVVSRSAAFATLVDNEKRTAKETAEALRMQARSWRQLAMIALADPERAKGLAQMLIMHTVPWVDGEWVSKFIAEHEQDAKDCGLRAGVFTP